jgi:hypothetical protein
MSERIKTNRKYPLQASALLAAAICESKVFSVVLEIAIAIQKTISSLEAIGRDIDSMANATDPHGMSEKWEKAFLERRAKKSNDSKDPQ